MLGHNALYNPTPNTILSPCNIQSRGYNPIDRVNARTNPGDLFS